MKRNIILAALLVVAICAEAQDMVRFGNEAADTAVITRMLDAALAANLPTPEARIAYFAHQFEGVPYGAHLLDQDPATEVLTVRIDSVDCTTFVETVMALAMTTGERRTSWRDFVYNLRRIRYRGGETDGYPSRLHYIADWAVDNRHRGNFTDVSDTFVRHNYVTRSIDFMTGHRDRYPALADSANYARMQAVESGYRNHRFPYVKSIDLGTKAVKAAFRNGDVVGFVSTLKDLDITHMGIIVKTSADADPYVLHASMSNGKVEVSKQPLADFVKRNRGWMGVRVFRLTE